MKRILPKQVLEAYRKTKTVPGTGHFIFCNAYEGKTYCCGIGVMALSFDLVVLGGAVNSKIVDKLGIDNGYMHSFIEGFDGESPLHDETAPTELNVQGYLDGLNSHLLVAEHLEELKNNANVSVVE